MLELLADRGKNTDEMKPLEVGTSPPIAIVREDPEDADPKDDDGVTGD